MLHDPFALLGLHERDGHLFVTTLWPAAQRCRIEPRLGGPAVELLRQSDGFFRADLGQKPRFDYRVIFVTPDAEIRFERDPYNHGLLLSDWDLARFAEGRHHHLGHILGAQTVEIGGVEGIRFAVWAPNAQRVSVVGEWNGFEGRCHPMRLRHPFGVWELFLPGLKPGQLYKYEIQGQDGSIKMRADPVALESELPPATASRIATPSTFLWNDASWLEKRLKHDWRRAPMSVYEIHAGSWRLHPDGKSLNWREMAPLLVAHCQRFNFTHVEFLPMVQHPYEGSWGYQATGFFAPNSRHGTPDDLRYMVDCLHQAGIGILVDVVPAHFPKDDFALARFDGSPCYEYGDPREGEHKEWGTLIFNHRRPEVRCYIIGSILHWIQEFHIDGIRVDAVSAMLYRNYARQDGEWIANPDGTNANWDAVIFLRELTGTIHLLHQGVLCIAEESTAWQGVTAPCEMGGLGFDLKWNMGWMHDSLSYFSLDSIMRPGSHDRATFHQWYGYDERWVLPLSHDEVVHGKKSLLDRMPGDWWQRRANLRMLYAWQAAVPGRPLMFMGGEWGQGHEWAWQKQLDWHESEESDRQGLMRCLSAALGCYVKEPALHEADDERTGFQWVDVQNRQESILAFLRHAPGRRSVLCVFNFTPIPRHNYPLGVCQKGVWTPIFNSDLLSFGGSDMGPQDGVRTLEHDFIGSWPAMIRVDLPPLAALFLVCSGE